jgi:hypothetical protein
MDFAASTRLESLDSRKILTVLAKEKDFPEKNTLNVP